MTRSLFRFLPLAALLMFVGGAPVSQGQGPTLDPPEKKFEEFDKVVKGAKDEGSLSALSERRPFLC